MARTNGNGARRRERVILIPLIAYIRKTSQRA